MKNEESFLMTMWEVLERCSQNRFEEAERLLDSIGWRMVEDYEPDYSALLALSREAVVGVPRALEDAQNLYNEITYRRRTGNQQT